MSDTHYSYGSGVPGCLYDFGPHFAETKEQAIEGVLTIVEDQLSKRSLARIRRDLEQHGIHYLDRRLRPFCGLSYLEISEQAGPCPDNDD